jgi:hypothetical protein
MHCGIVSARSDHWRPACFLLWRIGSKSPTEMNGMTHKGDVMKKNIEMTNENCQELTPDELAEVHGGFFLTLGLIAAGLIAVAIDKC